MTILAPDAIADQILEKIAYHGNVGVPADKLLELIPGHIEASALYKSIVYSWIKNNSNLEVIVDGKIIATPDSLDVAPKNSFVRSKEEYQWLALTGSPRENNVVGNAAFQLLCEIAKRGPEGIDSLTLAKVTGQDNRSLTSRFKMINQLVKKLSVVKNGRSLSLLILNKFFDEGIFNKDSTISTEGSSDILLNMAELREKITTTLKNSKSGIRQLADLRRELEMDKNKRRKVNFKSATNYLVEKGFIVKVLIVSNVSPTKKIRSLKYIKDYTLNDPQDNEFEADDDFFNNDLIDDDLKDLDDEEEEHSASVLSNTAASIEILEATASNIHVPRINRFYPVQNQLYEAVHEHGPVGCSTSFLIEEFFGTEYNRLFSKYIESYTSGKLLAHLSDLGIIRHYDFIGRVKFYRYLTRPNLLKLTHKPEDHNGLALPPYKQTPNISLDVLNKKSFSTMGAKLGTYRDVNNNRKVLWRGDISKTTGIIKEESKNHEILEGIAQPSKKRGRPKKGEERPKSEAKKSKKNQDQSVISADIIDTTNQELQNLQDLITQKKNGDIEVKSEFENRPNDVIISTIKGTSFKALEREAAILRLLDDSDGVRVSDHKFLSEVREELGYIVDKRTLKKDLDSLVEQQKLIIEEVTDETSDNSDLSDEDDGFDGDKTYRTVNDDDLKIIHVTTLLISSTATINAIENTKRVIQQNRISKKSNSSIQKLEELNLDIDFFDTELRDSFNKVPSRKISQEETGKSTAATPKRSRSVKPKNPIEKPVKLKATSGQKYTGKVEPTEIFDPNTSTVDELFENVRSKARPNFKVSKNDNDSLAGPQGRKRRNLHNLTSVQSLILFKAVVICKTINENQINWPKISNLLNVDANVLKTKWPRLRMMMGANGIKIAKRNWKKILLKSVREGRIEINDIENLQLQELVEVWEEAEYRSSSYTQDDILTDTNLFDENRLYVNIDDNYKHYKFTKLTGEEKAARNTYDANSMIQREHHLINSVFTYDELDKIEEDEDDIEGVKDFDEIKTAIIAIVASGHHSDINKLTVLEKFDGSDVDKVFLKLVKNRQVVIAHQTPEVQSSNTHNALTNLTPTAKVVIGDKITSLLDDNTFDIKLPKLSRFQKVLKELFESDKGLVLNPLFENSYMVPIIELIKDNSLNLTRVDHYRKEVLTGYEARTLEREKLDSDIILSSLANASIKNPQKLKAPIPRGKPCSHVWVLISGQINVELWTKILKVVVSTLISKPGITQVDLKTALNAVLSKKDLLAILKWLEKTGAVKQGDFNGYWLQPQWYMSLGF